ncbi:MAG: calcium/proton exchanger [Frankiaceae bacterium]
MRALLWWSLLLVPIDLAADLAGANGTVLFALSALALVPLAYVIGEATEQAGEHTGPAVAGLLNATFGNAPELIIALFAIHRGLLDFVRGSLTGSVVSNLLLVLGATLMVGRGGVLNRRTGLTWLAQVALAVVLFAVPAAAHGWDGHDTRPMPALTVPIAVLLLSIYVVLTVRSVVRERARHLAERDEERVLGAWSLRTAMLVLAMSAVATAFVSEALTGSVEDFSRSARLDEFFVAAVIVAIIGNAAEHGGAIVIASRGNIELAAEIPLSSSAQVALMVVPLVVLVSYAMTPLPLAFRPVEIATMAVAVILPAAVVARGRGSRWWGGALLVAYVAAAAGYYAAA